MAKKSYNGVVLPDITDAYLDYLYPYVYIYVRSYNGGRYASLHATDTSGYLKRLEEYDPIVVYEYVEHIGKGAWINYVIALDDESANLVSGLYPGINSEYWVQDFENQNSQWIFDPVHWTNTSLYDEKGNLIYKASKPVEPFYLKDWLTGFLLGICGKPLRVYGGES